MAKKKTRLRKPIVPGSPVTYGEVLKDRAAEEKLRYGPVRGELNQRDLHTNNWFDQYKADVAAKGLAQGQVYQQAVEGVQGRATASQAMSEVERARLDAEMRADAASRGAAYSGLPGVQAQAGSQERAGLAGAFANLLSSQGAANTAYTADQSVVGSASQLAERLRTQKAREELGREVGAWRQTYLGERRDDESKNVLERLVFGQDVAEAEALDRDRRRDNQRMSAAERRQQAADDRAAEKDAYQREHQLGPYKPAGSTTGDGKDKYGNTKVQRRANNNNWREAVTNANEYGDDDGLLAYLTTEVNVPHDIAQIAAYKVKHGQILPKHAKTLRRLGIKFNPKLVKRPVTLPVYQPPDNHADPHYGGT